MTIFSDLDLMEVLSKPVLLLATLGGAAAGAIGSGLVAQLMTRWLTLKKLPPLPTAMARGAGGLALGLLTALWVWQGGGGSGGPAGPGGIGGSGTGETKSEPATPPAGVADETRDKDKTSLDNADPPSPESVLRLEVLGNDDVRKQGGQQAVDQKRYYRVEGETDLKNMEDLRKLIQKRREKSPLQALYVETRENDPAEKAARSGQLRTLAADFGLKVEFH